ncbi:MAG: SPOR domain-containing protein [Myxococcota bacterium]|nr:SPOR domain-containing protein [Myxococcota bacterium]
MPSPPIKGITTAHAAVLAFASVCLVAIIAAHPTEAYANAEAELSAIKTHVQKIMDRCRTLKTSSRKVLSALRETTEDVNQNEQLGQLQNRIPFVCNEVSASGYAILEYANRLSKQCLACLGGVGMCPPDQARRCQADSESLSDKNYDFALYQKNLVELIDTYNRAISQAGKRGIEPNKNPKVRSVAKDKEARQMRQRLAASIEKVKQQTEQCVRLNKAPRLSSALRSACGQMKSQSVQFLKIASQLNYECLLCVRGGKCQSQARFDQCRAIWTKYAASEELMASAHASVIEKLPSLTGDVTPPSKQPAAKNQSGVPTAASSQRTQSKATGTANALPTIRLKPSPKKTATDPIKTSSAAKDSAPKPLDSTNLFSRGKAHQKVSYPKFGPGPWAHFGSFLNEYYARSLTTKLKNFGHHFQEKQLRYDRELVKKKKRPDGVYYFRVRIGPFANRSDVNDFCDLMRKEAQIDTCKSGKPPKTN